MSQTLPRNTQQASSLYLTDAHTAKNVMKRPPYQLLCMPLKSTINVNRMLTMMTILREKLKDIWFDQYQQSYLRFVQNCIEQYVRRYQDKISMKVENTTQLRRWVYEVIMHTVADKEFDVEPYYKLIPWLRGCMAGVLKRDEGWSYVNSSWCLIFEQFKERAWKLEKYRWDCWLSPKLMSRIRAQSEGKRDIRSYTIPYRMGYTVNKKYAKKVTTKHSGEKGKKVVVKQKPKGLLKFFKRRGIRR